MTDFLFCSVCVGIFGGKQIGPWPWAPWLTSFVTPTFFGFLVGPSRTNRRIDGSLGGLLVEKCKFLQVSSLFMVATNPVAHCAHLFPCARSCRFSRWSYFQRDHLSRNLRGAHHDNRTRNSLLFCVLSHYLASTIYSLAGIYISAISYVSCTSRQANPSTRCTRKQRNHA